MGCTFRARLNSLWSIWYTIIVVLLQGYLIYLGFERYKLYNEMKWPANGGYPVVWLNVYVILYIACIPILLSIFASGVFKTGNIPGDHERLADREERVIETGSDKNGDKRGCFHCLRSLWAHSPPLPHHLHLVVALMQLVAQQLMIAQLYRNAFIQSDVFLNTELDFIYQRAKLLATNLPIGETRIQGFSMTSDKLSAAPIAPNLLPILMHFRLFGIPLEFVNFILALIAYSISYPAVFWRVSKSFALLFSLHLFIFSVTLVFSYLGFSILFRVQETNYHSIRPVGIGQYLLYDRNLRMLHPYAVLGEFLAAAFFTHLSGIMLYAYGYNKYFMCVANQQAKNVSRSGTSEYTDFSRRHQSHRANELCCDGYGPHMSTIFMLVLIIAAKSPYVYAFVQIWQHDDRPILLSILVVDVVYMFTLILLWLMLTIKREWDFDVSHYVHQVYALQKGMTAGPVRSNENPSKLKNAVIVMHRDTMFVTDDHATKQSLLRACQRGGELVTDETAYWQRANGGHQSPGMRKIPMEERIQQTPEMTRLLAGRKPSDDNSQISRLTQAQPQPIQFRGNSSPPDGRYGTLPRNQQTGYYTSTLQRVPASTSNMQRSAQGWNTQQEAYASIHKGKGEVMFPQRRGSQDEQYGQYGQYGTYGRVGNQARIAVPPNGPMSTSMRVNGNGQYATGMQQQLLQRQPSDGQGASVSAVRQSPLLGQEGRPGARDPSPYQRTAGVKMSSFNSTENKGSMSGIYGTVPPQWNASSSQRAAPGQPQQLLWNGSGQTNKSSASSSQAGTISASSSQQDNQCFTPTSTLTSQGSTTNYSNQHTPTPGSPSLYSTNHRSALYGNIGDEGIYADRTLQKRVPILSAVNSGTLRSVKAVPPPRQDDSANFSLSSSNGSQETPRVPAPAPNNTNDFATSIV
ncbi:unnamed protein product, partial [Mesorhabditis belari]|uniref:Uncharacterized protein n=1 Tax=Mesorhabditis belari TaxID=2138241 RepID=A0AAF3J375_9BILA